MLITWAVREKALIRKLSGFGMNLLMFNIFFEIYERKKLWNYKQVV